MARLARSHRQAADWLEIDVSAELLVRVDGQPGQPRLDHALDVAPDIHRGDEREWLAWRVADDLRDFADESGDLVGRQREEVARGRLLDRLPDVLLQLNVHEQDGQIPWAARR